MNEQKNKSELLLYEIKKKRLVSVRLPGYMSLEKEQLIVEMNEISSNIG